MAEEAGAPQKPRRSRHRHQRKSHHARPNPESPRGLLSRAEETEHSPETPSRRPENLASPGGGTIRLRYGDRRRLLDDGAAKGQILFFRLFFYSISIDGEKALKFDNIFSFAAYYHIMPTSCIQMPSPIQSLPDSRRIPRNGESAAIALRGRALDACAGGEGPEHGDRGAARAQPLQPGAPRESPPPTLQEARKLSRSCSTYVALFWHDGCTTPGNCVNLSSTLSSNINIRTIKPCLQCTCTPTVYRVAP